MAPIPLPSSAPQTPPSSLPHLATPIPGEEGGFCGLTGDQWHLVLLLVVLPLLLALLVVIIISWVKQEDIALLWSGAQERVEMTRTELREKLFGHLLSESDVLLITPGANITPRHYPLVAFLLALVRRGPGSP